MSVALSGPYGSVDLVPELCVPGFVSPIDDDDFAHWCDGSGHLSIRVTGTPGFQTQVHDELIVHTITLASVAD